MPGPMDAPRSGRKLDCQTRHREAAKVIGDEIDERWESESGQSPYIKGSHGKESEFRRYSTATVLQ